jgi:phosphoserine phosphatase
MKRDIALCLFQKADCVCLDVDSTVLLDEGIDVLAEASGQAAAVRELTGSAMGGTLDFHQVLTDSKHTSNMSWRSCQSV